MTRDVGGSPAHEIAQALRAGAACAKQLVARGLILAAALHLQGETRMSRVIGAHGRTPESRPPGMQHMS